MKNRIKVFGIIVAVTAIGFSMTGCGRGGGRAGPEEIALNGTWTGMLLFTNVELVFDNGNYTLKHNGAYVERGTFRVQSLGDSRLLTPTATHLFQNGRWSTGGGVRFPGSVTDDNTIEIFASTLTRR